MNAHLPIYCSWRPDLAALAVDALSITWQGHFKQEGVTAVLIAPVWPNQVWFPQLLQSLSDYPILLPSTQDILTNPDGHSHLLVVQGHLPLAAWLVSGAPGSLRGFQTQLSWSSGDPGGILQKKLIQAPGTYGNAVVLNRVLISFQFLFKTF